MRLQARQDPLNYPIKLNNQIVGEAQRFAHDFGSEAHFVNAYADRNRAPDRAELARICGVAPERMHTAQGAAASVIRDTAESIGADLILIETAASIEAAEGAGLLDQEVTAEVLDAVGRDVHVVVRDGVQRLQSSAVPP